MEYEPIDWNCPKLLGVCHKCFEYSEPHLLVHPQHLIYEEIKISFSNALKGLCSLSTPRGYDSILISFDG